MGTRRALQYIQYFQCIQFSMLLMFPILLIFFSLFGQLYPLFESHNVIFLNSYEFFNRFV